MSISYASSILSALSHIDRGLLIKKGYSWSCTVVVIELDPGFSREALRPKAITNALSRKYNNNNNNNNKDRIAAYGPCESEQIYKTESCVTDEESMITRVQMITGDCRRTCMFSEYSVTKISTLKPQKSYRRDGLGNFQSHRGATSHSPERPPLHPTNPPDAEGLQKMSCSNYVC
ncbi:hypothetical protein BGZ63DRAFT_403547 [Mariannaea sp. PMI_226]|nr:hypothetical protein BGZ63DRAFT_403547 [Mariannaea sp. PMI_226]